MGKFISNFDTTAELATFSATTDFGRPHVSLTKDDSKVHYFEEDPYNGHQYVEIGGLKWATMNVGATGITDCGLYFEWGNPQGYSADQIGCEEGKKCFDNCFADYKWIEDGGSTFTKYNDEDGLTTLQSADDAVAAAWGGNWRMPTTEEFQALGTATTSAWTADYEGSGVAGLVLTSNADSSKKLFFPACGDASNGSVSSVGSYGNYWSSSLYSDYVYNACSLYFSNGDVNWDVNWNGSDNRFYGCSVRGVVNA